MTSSKLVDNTLKKISKRFTDTSSNREFDNFLMVLGNFPPVARTLFDLFIGGKESDSTCHMFLSRLVDRWTEHASEESPRRWPGFPILS